MNKKNQLRKLLVDTTTAVSFSLAVGGINELYILGLPPEQCMKSRAINALNNIVLGRPYGLYRDSISGFFDCNKVSGLMKKLLTNTLAFASFWTPVYAGVLYLSGASEEQIQMGCLSVTAMSTFLGGPYGYYLDSVRKLFGLNNDIKRLNK